MEQLRSPPKIGKRGRRIRTDFLNLQADRGTLRQKERAVPGWPQGAGSDRTGGEWLMLRCRDIVELLGDYLDGELNSATAEALNAHLADCQECTAFINTYRGTVRVTRQLKEEDLPPLLRERLLTFLRQHKQS